MIELFIATSVSFFIGAMGYMITYYWIRPWRAYRRVKKQAAHFLSPLLSSSADNVRPDGKTLRQIASDLSDMYHDKIPLWYRLNLVRRGEDPVEAAKRLSALANTRNPDQMVATAREIAHLLKLR